MWSKSLPVAKASFNTQPPEGGWRYGGCRTRPTRGFNTQPPEGGWRDEREERVHYVVSTHSRPKAAGLVV